MTRPLLILLAITSATLGAADDEARGIVRRSMALHERNAGLARNYTFLERIEERRLDSQGRETSKESRTYDTTILFGIPYRRLIQRDDRRLPPQEERKEQETLARTFAERKSESEAQRKGRLSGYEKRQERGRAYLREIPDAFDFRLLGEEQRQGRAVHVIDAIPRAGYQPRDARAKTLLRLHAKLWIDKSDLQWMRVEAEVIDTISVWLFLARLGTGSRLEFEQIRVNDEIWLPQIVRASGAVRIALLKKLQGDVTITYRGYRKFQSESEVALLGSAP
jgi:hypothetical protein